MAHAKRSRQRELSPGRRRGRGLPPVGDLPDPHVMPLLRLPVVGGVGATIRRRGPDPADDGSLITEVGVLA